MNNYLNVNFESSSGLKAHNRNFYRLQHEEKHIKQLQKLGYKYSTLKALRVLENKANYIATQACNGEIDDQEYDHREIFITSEVKRLFNGKLPKGFFVNGDPRGYALKCEGNDKISFTDWGSYQILAPTRENF